MSLFTKLTASLPKAIAQEFSSQAQLRQALGGPAILSDHYVKPAPKGPLHLTFDFSPHFWILPAPQTHSLEIGGAANRPSSKQHEMHCVGKRGGSDAVDKKAKEEITSALLNYFANLIETGTTIEGAALELYVSFVRRAMSLNQLHLTSEHKSRLKQVFAFLQNLPNAQRMNRLGVTEKDKVVYSFLARLVEAYDKGRLKDQDLIYACLQIDNDPGLTETGYPLITGLVLSTNAANQLREPYQQARNTEPIYAVEWRKKRVDLNTLATHYQAAIEGWPTPAWKMYGYYIRTAVLDQIAEWQRNKPLPYEQKASIHSLLELAERDPHITQFEKNRLAGLKTKMSG